MAGVQWLQPEQRGPASVTYLNIENSMRQRSYSSSENKLPFNSAVAKDYIPLEGRKSDGDLVNKSGGKDGKLLKRKLTSSEKACQNYTGTCNEHVSTAFNVPSTPWKTRDYDQKITGLHEEILDFFNYIKPRPEEDAIRLNVVKRVEAVIKHLWPKAKVELYGSCQTGLYLPTSDIDLVVHGKWESLPLRTLEIVLIEQEIADANSIRVLDKASVPIIKITDKKTHVKIDISFNMNNGVQSAEMIKAFMAQYPALPYLTFVLKQLLVHRDLNEVFSGGISSYTVVLMIVSFFQHSGYCGDGKPLEMNLGVLLIHFFELYGTQFNYNNVGIRVVDGGSYFNKEEVLGSAIANATHLCIEDPLTQGNYIGKASFRISDVRSLFFWSYGQLTNVLNVLPGTKSSSILGRIMEVRKDTVEQRERMLRLSPQMSPSKGMPTYASVATRNTACRPTVRSKRDLSTDSTSTSDGFDARNAQCVRAKHDSPKRNDTTGVLTHSDLKGQKNVCCSPTRSDAEDVRTRTKTQPKRDDRQLSRQKTNERKSQFDRTPSRFADNRTPEKECALYSPKRRSSPKRTSPTMAESCGLRSQCGRKPSKEIQRRPERLVCK